VSAGTRSSTRVISRILVPGGAFSVNSTMTPTIVFFRNGTSTRLPGCTVSRKTSGTAYVKVVRSGTANATLQNGKLITTCSVSAGGNRAEKGQGESFVGMQNYLLIRKMPAKIVTIPANCQREIRSRRNAAASATVTAP
jgi:hypothetical protein